MATVSFRQVFKEFTGGVLAVNDFTLDVMDKEFIALVGPSGSGKSTVLRCLAGLEEVTRGDILIDGESVIKKPPKNRGIAMVFQGYALFNHMTVFDNIALGLKIGGMAKSEIKEAVESAAEMLGLGGVLKRRPRALSGGQQQRVALGRALVMKPKVFLLDEPLSNLDAKLRSEMRSEIIRLHERVKTTFIYVTHDQVEAMTMGSRIVVMQDGYIRQAAPPSELYNNPADRFVAGFIGTPQMNFLEGCLRRTGESSGRADNDTNNKTSLNMDRIVGRINSSGDLYSRATDMFCNKLSGNMSKTGNTVDGSDDNANEITNSKRMDNADDNAGSKSKNSTATVLEICGEQITFPVGFCVEKDTPVVVGIRPEDIVLAPAAGTQIGTQIGLVAIISLIEELGAESIIYADILGGANGGTSGVNDSTTKISDSDHGTSNGTTKIGDSDHGTSNGTTKTGDSANGTSNGTAKISDSANGTNYETANTSDSENGARNGITKIAHNAIATNYETSGVYDTNTCICGNNLTVKFRLSPSHKLKRGDRITIALLENKIKLFDGISGKSLL